MTGSPCPQGQGAWGVPQARAPGRAREARAARSSAPASRQVRSREVLGAGEPPGEEPCGALCLDNPVWVCARASGHMGRHESADGGDWHDA